MNSGQSQVFESLKSILLADSSISTAVVVGSICQPDCDDWSDIDLLVYLNGPILNRQDLGGWLTSKGLRPSAHFWNGINKHRLLIDGVRVDIRLRTIGSLSEVLEWPEIYFEPKDILKDSSGRLADLLSRHAALDIADEDNDEDGFLLALLSVSIQLVRGEYINARSRATGLLEGFLRTRVALNLGSVTWREPSRHLENSGNSEAIEWATKLVEAPTENEFRCLLAAELQSVLGRRHLDTASRTAIADLLNQLANTRRGRSSAEASEIR